MHPLRIAAEGTHAVLDVFGPTVEFLTDPHDPQLPYCVILGTLPPGVAVPIHSHPDTESFCVLSGATQVLSEADQDFIWNDIGPGSFVHIPGGAKHAFRNTSADPVVQLITTTPQLGRFFEEIGRPVTPGVPLPPPTHAELEHFAQLAARYHHWLATPEQNAAMGILFP